MMSQSSAATAITTPTTMYIIESLSGSAGMATDGANVRRHEERHADQDDRKKNQPVQ